jgi:hypothetical protein
VFQLGAPGALELPDQAKRTINRRIRVFVCLAVRPCGVDLLALSPLGRLSSKDGKRILVVVRFVLGLGHCVSSSLGWDRGTGTPAESTT